MANEYTRETTTDALHLRDDGILVVSPLPVDQNAEHARETLAAGQELLDGRDGLVLVDLRNARGISREARQIYTQADFVIAQAMIVGSSFTRAAAQFFIGLSASKHPIRAFTSEQEATSWLLAQADVARAG